MLAREALLEESVLIAEQAGNDANLARQLVGLANLLLSDGEAEDAVRLLERAMSSRRQDFSAQMCYPHSAART